MLSQQQPAPLQSSANPPPAPQTLPFWNQICAPCDKIQERSVMRREPVSPASSGFITYQLWNIKTLFSITSWLTGFLCNSLRARILNFALGDPWHLQVLRNEFLIIILGLPLWNWLRSRADSYFSLVHIFFVSYFLLYFTELTFGSGKWGACHFSIVVGLWEAKTNRSWVLKSVYIFK